MIDVFNSSGPSSDHDYPGSDLRPLSVALHILHDNFTGCTAVQMKNGNILQLILTETIQIEFVGIYLNKKPPIKLAQRSHHESYLSQHEQEIHSAFHEFPSVLVVVVVVAAAAAVVDGDDVETADLHGTCSVTVVVDDGENAVGLAAENAVDVAVAAADWAAALEAAVSAAATLELVAAAVGDGDDDGDFAAAAIVVEDVVRLLPLPAAAAAAEVKAA